VIDLKRKKRVRRKNGKETCGHMDGKFLNFTLEIIFL